MVTTVKSGLPNVSAMSSRRHRRQRHRPPPAVTSVSFRLPRSISSSVRSTLPGRRSPVPVLDSFVMFWVSCRGALVALCCLFLVLVLALSVSVAAEDSAEDSDGDGGCGCLGFRDSCADLTSFCFSPSVARTLLASEDGNEGADLGGSRDWGPSSRPLSFPMSDGSVVTCSSVDTMIIRVRDGLVPEGDGGVMHNVAACHAPLVPDNWMRESTGVPLELDGTAAAVNPIAVHSSLNMNVAISPPVLDWGSSDLYAASTATLTVANLNNDSTLRLFEPFSTDPQFYVYGYEDLELQPGDNASITFVFLPKLLGFSSAHLVLQTNFGGFIIQAKGMAVSSPYQILPLTGIDVVVGDRLERNLSIYNPYNDTLYVEEVAVWMSSLESTGQSSHIVCQLGHSAGALEISSLNSNWYTAKSAESGRPMIYVRPSEQWEVLPSKSNSVVELKLQALSEGKMFGAISLKLRNCTAATMHTFVIPIELEVHKRTYYDSSGLVAVTFERTSSCGASGSIFSLYLQNDASNLLRVVGVTENSQNGAMIFQVKYLNGLILFPGTVTHIALVSHIYSVPDPDDISFNSCNLVVETNSTLGSSIIIPCEDLLHASLAYTSNAVVAESDRLFTGPLYEEAPANAKMRNLGSMLQVKGLHSVKKVLYQIHSLEVVGSILRSCNPACSDLCPHSNKKSRSIKEHKRTEEVPTEKYSSTVLDSTKRPDDRNNPGEQVNTISTVSVSPANPMEDKAPREAPQTSDNLTIRISRDKGKRRRRKVGGAGLAAKFEVSSSHSGNSTPSSPLSPSSTPKQGWSSSGAPSELKHENKLDREFDVEATAASTGTNRGKKSWSQTAKEQPRPSSATPRNTSPPDTVLTSGWRSPLLAISSPIAPHARAPGSNLMKDKVLKGDEGATPKKEFTYDIWGHNFSGHLLGKAREVAPYNMFDASEGGSCSFFAKEPQALMMKPSSAPHVSRGRGTPPSDVSSGYGIK
ncbi:hypothetical protein PR202_gb18819 [Eleusine coracana subsp. coracana]|uniref:Transmembrane protein 131-like N-terminal domain-containing protein n=1 Tax=Eleusine coracana subsp. coracana TaxID=191504 RepID=A0AAV5F4C9_ELECO|nr:hypothetical protein PR202_gb18819 [Eleusine coracana subsp. coracana]